MADIFISYAHEDRSKAHLLAKAFEERGWSVWSDTRLEAGESWDDVIDRELNAARCVVVLWSKTSVHKYWVRVEANEGLRRRILVPALIEDVQPPLAFRLIQAEHLIDWSGESSHPGLNQLLATVSKRLRVQNWAELTFLLTDWPHFEASVRHGAGYDVVRAYAANARAILNAGKSAFLPEAAALALAERYVAVIDLSNWPSVPARTWTLEETSSHLEDAVERSPYDVSCTLALSAAATALAPVCIGSA